MDLTGRNPQDTFLRNVVFNDQLRTRSGICVIAAVQTEIIGNAIVVVIQLEAQTDLGQTRQGGQLVDEGFSTRQIDAVPVAHQAWQERTKGFARSSLEVTDL